VSVCLAITLYYKEGPTFTKLPLVTNYNKILQHLEISPDFFDSVADIFTVNNCHKEMKYIVYNKVKSKLSSQ
jgi:hypothetical protein